jgi:hypothetical protein
MTQVSHKKKLAAWHAVEKAINNGTLVVPPVCEVCGKPPAGKGGSALQSHHDDYDKPLDVKFLCKRCHMKLHYGNPAKKKDNSTGDLKASLRKNLIKEIQNPVVMETHGGKGVLFDKCYAGIDHGVVFEKSPDKTKILAEQRPGWFVYEANCLYGIKTGAGKSLPVNFVDIDPYGDPWPVISVFFESRHYLPQVLGLAVNDGLRHKLRMHGGWRCASLVNEVQKYGNKQLYGSYLDICQEKLKNIAGSCGYKIHKWAGYHCGAQKQMTHYAAVLVR